MVVSGRRYLLGILVIAFLLLAALVTIGGGAEPASAADTEGTICAVVTDANTGLPLRGHYVSFTSSGGALHVTTTTDSEGRACYTDGIADTITIRVWDDTAQYVVASGTVDLVLGATNELAVPVPVGTLCGVITDGVTTDPIAGNSVDFRVVDSGRYLGNAVTDPGGRACIDLHGDSLEITVRAGASPTYLAKSAIGTLLGGQVVDVPIALDQVKPGSISGVVTAVGSGSPLSGIAILAAGGNEYGATTDADGSYTIPNLPRDYYRIIFSDPSVVYGTQWYTSAVEIDGTGAAVTGIDAVLDLAGSISGTIVDETTGNPIEGIQVNVHAGTPWVTRTSTALTDAGGEYTVGGLGVGDHYVSFWHPNYRSEWWDNVSYGGEAAAIAVTAGSATADFDAALTRVSAISGRVYDGRTGEGIPLKVSAEGTYGGVQATPVGTTYFTRLSDTDADGHYHIGGLDPGSWDLIVDWGGSWNVPPDDFSSFFRVDHPCGVAPPVPLGEGEWVDGIDFVLRAFCDVESGKWYFKSVEAVAAAGIADGRPDGSFGPNDTMTRAEMAAFMVKALGETPTTPTVGPFPDVSLGKWYTGYIDKAKELGLTVGKPDGSYAPEENVTRGETAAFLYRAKEGVVPPDRPTVEPFPDVPVTKWHAGYIDWMKQADYTTGRPDGTYGPEDSITRAEMATFLERIYIP